MATKKKMYKTAQATIGCAHFPAGAYVSISYSHTNSNGVTWYTINRSEQGELPSVVGYPHHHLHNFWL